MEKVKCDFCASPAIYDGKTILGPWAYMCEEHFVELGVGVGLGLGQRLAEITFVVGRRETDD